MIALHDNLDPADVTAVRDGNVIYIPAGPDADVWHALYRAPLLTVVVLDAEAWDALRLAVADDVAGVVVLK